MILLSELLPALEKANRVAQERDWRSLGTRSLELIAEVCQAEAALLRWPVISEHQPVWWGRPGNMREDDWALPRKAIFLQPPFASDNTQFLEKGQIQEIYANHAQDGGSIQNLLLLPLTVPADDHQPGDAGIVLVNCHQPQTELAEMIAGRLASELDKAAQLALHHELSARMKELNTTHHQQGTSLDPKQVLDRLMDQARQILQVEAVSLFLFDEFLEDETLRGDLVLYRASQLDTQINVDRIRVPPGKGIIGYVVQTGETVVVDDVNLDQRHYGQIDSNSGFTTRSILAVPLVARSVTFGHERAGFSERIVGGLEAINKISGCFSPEDAELLQELSNRAATEWVVAQMFDRLNVQSKNRKELFEDFIKALADAFDARDKKNPGHSGRVSSYAIAIGKEMELSPQELENLRIGSILHDIGKIGVEDAILNKPGTLDPHDWEQMRKHPATGKSIIDAVRQMPAEIIQAIYEHHEKMNGTGYPNGLSGGQISRIGRIVAVADVFDALTSKRPYRPVPMSAEEALEQICERTGDHFDPDCVEALIRSYQKGNIRPL